VTPPTITTRAWTPLTPRATPIPPSPDISHAGTTTPELPFGDTQLSEHAWERAFVRALPGEAGYLIHRAWYAFDKIEDGWRHDPGGPLDAACLSLWQWWQHCHDYRDPHGSEIGRQAYLDTTGLLVPYTDTTDLAPYEHLPRAYADAYPVGAIVWDGHHSTAVQSRVQLEALYTTESHTLLGNLWVGPYRTDNPHDAATGVQRGGVSVRQKIDNHSIAWHSAAVTDPGLCLVHPSRAAAAQHLVRTHHAQRRYDATHTQQEGQASP